MEGAMNNHIPDDGKMVCPHCGAEVLNPEGSQRYYYCGSTMESGDQSAICVTRQRDQLRARVEELESQVSSQCLQIDGHEDEFRKMVERYNVKVEGVEQLENWCERMANMLEEGGWESRAQNEFRKYMVTKP
jgi:ribosomal protein S27AE